MTMIKLQSIGGQLVNGGVLRHTVKYSEDGVDKQIDCLVENVDTIRLIRLYERIIADNLHATNKSE